MSDQAGDQQRSRLDALRAELDRVDDALHDLLMHRSEVVTQVKSLGAKGRVPLRPGREASIICRLLARNAGALAPATLVRIWRELLAGSSAQQDLEAVVIGDRSLEQAVREHFGALIRTETMDPAAAIDRLRQGGAPLAVLPLPSGEARWWTSLVDDGRWPRIHVVARLPFWARPGAAEAMVLSTAAPDPSGHDLTLIAYPAPAPPITQSTTRTLATSGSLILAEIDGFVMQDDPRLAGTAASVLGAYAVPVGEFS